MPWRTRKETTNLVSGTNKTACTTMQSSSALDIPCSCLFVAWWDWYHFMLLLSSSRLCSNDSLVSRSAWNGSSTTVPRFLTATWQTWRVCLCQMSMYRAYSPIDFQLVERTNEGCWPWQVRRDWSRFWRRCLMKTSSSASMVFDRASPFHFQRKGADYRFLSLSKKHKDQPWGMDVHGQRYEVNYWPGDSHSGMFGGNSNWRGPICEYADNS